MIENRPRDTAQICQCKTVGVFSVISPGTAKIKQIFEFDDVAKICVVTQTSMTGWI